MQDKHTHTGPEAGSEIAKGQYGIEEPISLKDFVNVLVRRRWTMLIFFLTTVLVVGAFTYTIKPVYRATIKILIERESPNILNIKDILPMEASGSDFYQTQYRILQSRNLAQRVINGLNLAKDKDFNPEHSDSEPDALKKPDTDSQDSQKAQEVKEILISRFLNALDIQPVSGTRLVDISFSNHSPELSAKVANYIGKAYMEMNVDLKFGASRRATEWLERQISEQKAKLEESERAMLYYRQETGLISLEDKENIVSQRLSQLNADLVKAESRRIAIEEQYNHIRYLIDQKVPFESIPAIADNSLIQGLKGQEIKVITKVSDLKLQYGEKHPKMISAKAEIASLRQNLKNTGENLVSGMKNKYIIVRQQEDQLRRALTKQTQELEGLSEKAIRYRVLKRETNTNKDIYNTLLKRLKETALTEDIKAYNVRIIDPATIPLKPANDKKRRNLLLALIVGLFGSIGLAFSVEFLDDSIKYPEDIERQLGLSSLAMIPLVKTGTRKALGKKGDRVEWIIQARPRSSASEAFRRLRANLLFSFGAGPSAVILVTSAASGEGKTFTTVNLGISLAKLGKKVLLIDADMRNPGLHCILNLNNEEGLSHSLVGAGRPRPQSALHANMDIMPCGSVPSDHAELLASQAMANIMDEQRNLYDFVILDSPPVEEVSDALVLGRLADSVILVVEGKKTTCRQIAKSVSAMKKLDIRILGAVLNMKRHRKAHFFGKSVT